VLLAVLVDTVGFVGFTKVGEPKENSDWRELLEAVEVDIEVEVGVLAPLGEDTPIALDALRGVRAFKPPPRLLDLSSMHCFNKARSSSIFDIVELLVVL
jgi:hypothetical protein